jgi:hypothetical protein
MEIHRGVIFRKVLPGHFFGQCMRSEFAILRQRTSAVIEEDFTATMA